MIPFDSLGSAICWLDKQGGFTQGLILAVVVAAGGGLWTFMKWAWRSVRTQEAVRRAAKGRRTQEIQADFKKGMPNAASWIKVSIRPRVRTQSSRSSGPRWIQLNAFSKSFRDTLAKLPENGDPNHVAKKQAVLQQAAMEIHSDVMALESVAKEVGPAVQDFIEAFRAVFALPINSDGDRQTLCVLKKTHCNGVAESFRQLASLLTNRREELTKLDGKQQDLSRMVRRAVQALDDMQKAASRVEGFCSREMSATIDRLIQ